MEKKVDLKHIPKLLWIFTIIVAVVCVASGLYCFISYIQRDKWTNLQQIVLSQENESTTLQFDELEVLPGETQKFKVNIVSKLYETVKYSISFTDHVLDESDKSLYVTVSNKASEPLINNTLYQIYNESISVSNQRISSYSEDVLTFQFGLSSSFVDEHDFDFKITIQAEGRIYNG